MAEASVRRCWEVEAAARRAVEVNGERTHWHARPDALDVSAGIVERGQWLWEVMDSSLIEEESLELEVVRPQLFVPEVAR